MRALHSRAIPVGIRGFGSYAPRSKARRDAGWPFWLGIVLLFVSCLHGNGQQQSTVNNPVPTSSAPNHASIAKNYAKLPLSFEANQGQADQRVRFLSRGNGYSLFLTDGEAVLALHKPSGTTSKESSDPTFKTDIVRMQLAGANANLDVRGEDKLPGTASYFIGNDPKRWQSGVPTFGKVKYEGVYPGIDLVYYGNQRQLEYDFVVAPHADVRSIRLRFAGASKLKLNENGDLKVIAKNGEIAFHQPVIYQNKDGRRNSIRGHFELVAKDAVGFAVGAYDPTQPLVIDPVLTYSTYLGGTQSRLLGDEAMAIAVDGVGNAYIAGLASSDDFPTTSTSYQPKKSTSSYGAFITKLDPTGSKLVYSTFIGGTSGTGDQANAIALDSADNVYITGSTQSPNFPVTPGAPQRFNNTLLNDHPTGFVTKLNADGASLGYSTYLGGSTQGDTGYGITVDGSGSAYVTGVAVSTDFPVTSGTYQSTSSPRGASLFVTKYSPNGTQLVYSVLLYGNNSSQGNAIAVDGSGNAYVTGYSIASNYPTTTGAFETGNPIDPTAPFSEGKCAVVTKLNADASALLYSTYLAGLGTGSSGSGLAIDSTGSAYITGFTTVGPAPGDIFPTTPGAYKTEPDVSIEDEVFLTKMKPDGSGLVYSTYVGAGAANGLAIDRYGNATIAGVTSASNFPQTADAIQPGVTLQRNNAFVSKFNATGSQLLYSTIMGTNDLDQANAVAVDSHGDAYVAGITTTSGFPTTADALIPAYPQPGSADTGFVTKLALGTFGAPITTTTTLTSDANPQDIGTKVTFTAYVQQASGTVIPTGSVSFTVDGGAGTAEALDDTGHASFTISTLTAGKHTINANYGGDVNYAASGASPLTETILGTAASITVVSGAGQIANYGSAFANPIVVIVKDVNSNPIPGAVVSFTGSGLKFSSTTATTGANGEASVTASAIAAGSLTASASTAGVSGAASFSLTANQVPLTITASNATVAFGQAIPALTYTVSGFVNGDTTAVLSGSPSETTTATQGSAVGNYPIAITKGTLADSNYSFQFVNGTLAITSLGAAATPTFSVAGGTYSSTQTIKISDTTPGATIYYTINGAIPTTSSTKYTGPVTVSSTETLKAIATAGGYSTSGVATATYTINTGSSTIAVVSGSPQTTPYGSAFANSLVVLVKDAGGNPVTGATVTFSGVGLSFSNMTATTGSNGEASVTVTAVAAGNLTASASTAGVTGAATFSLVATKVALTVTATNASIAYNQPIPTLAYSVTGFVHGDTSAVLSGAPSETTTATQGSLVGSYPITVTQGTLSATNYAFPNFVNGTLAITALGTVATPSLTPAAGTYTSTQSVTISDTTPGATIYYTTNGTSPTTTSSKYTAPIAVGSSETIEAIAVAAGYNNSAVATAAYIITLPPAAAATPTFSPASGTYSSGQSVTLSDGTAGATIYYTTDGSTPSTSSPKYSAAISVSSTETIEAIAVAPGYSNSAVATATYTINLPSPSFNFTTSPASATISSSQSATFMLTVTPQNGFNQSVSFSCSGLPSGDSCSFSPSTVTPSGAAINSTMTISAASIAKDSRLPLWEKESAGLALALLLWPFRRRKHWRRLAVMLLFLGGLTAVGCGGGTKPQNYNVSVTASGGGVSQTSSVSLTITR